MLSGKHSKPHTSVPASSKACVPSSSLLPILSLCWLTESLHYPSQTSSLIPHRPHHRRSQTGLAKLLYRKIAWGWSGPHKGWVSSSQLPLFQQLKILFSFSDNRSLYWDCQVGPGQEDSKWFRGGEPDIPPFILQHWPPPLVPALSGPPTAWATASIHAQFFSLPVDPEICLKSFRHNCLLNLSNLISVVCNPKTPADSW